MTNAAYLKARLAVYDAILHYWRNHDSAGLAADIADLERYRDHVHDWYLSACLKRGPQKPRVRTEKELAAFGKLFRKRKV